MPTLRIDNSPFAAAAGDRLSLASAAASHGGPSKKAVDGRKAIGEFVGNAFYGTLIKEMQAMKLKGSMLHGGRGEEVFGGQLALEMSKRIGQSANEPLSNRLYQTIVKRAKSGVASEQSLRNAARSKEAPRS